MEKLKIGIVGTGHLGKLHTKMLQQISKCELVGIYDSNPDQLAHASKEYNVREFGSLNEILENVDAVSIAVTTSAHFLDRKSTRLNSSHLGISYAVFCLKK